MVLSLKRARHDCSGCKSEVQQLQSLVAQMQQERIQIGSKTSGRRAPVRGRCSQARAGFSCSRRFFCAGHHHGRTDFGHLGFGLANFGQNQFWPIHFWICVCHGGALKGGAPKGRGQNFAFFPLPPQLSFFLLSLESNSGGVCSAWSVK